MDIRLTVVGIGESLFDIFQGERRLGGAPLNVAVHARQLAGHSGVAGVVVSRIGQDDLGNELLSELQKRDMTTEYIQTDPDRDTGQVYVRLSPSGEPSYDIVKNVAWDVLSFDFNDEDLARRCDAVCFGTLAQRDGQTRNTIYRFLDTARRALRFFDVNLREDKIDPRIILRSCERATALKVNQDELPIVADCYGLSGEGRGEVDEVHRKAKAIIRKAELDWLALTRGKDGTVLFTRDGQFTGARVPPDRFPRHEKADSVGAGDSTSAALVLGHLLQWHPQRIVDVANEVGAYVASRPGATPELPDAIRKQFGPLES